MAWLPWSGKGKDGKGKDGKSKGKGKDGKGKGKGRSGTNHDNFLDIFSMLSPSSQPVLAEGKKGGMSAEGKAAKNGTMALYLHDFYSAN